MIENGVDVIKHCANACGNRAIVAAVDAASGARATPMIRVL